MSGNNPHEIVIALIENIARIRREFFDKEQKH